MTTRQVVLVMALAVYGAASSSGAADPAITTYGVRNSQAPDQLNLFSFLVGNWSGRSKTRLADGSHAEWTWIGRYVLNGMAIADELHVKAEGKPYLGITLRQFDTEHDGWVVEFLNVSNSFLRRQVNPSSGSVSREADSVVVISEDAQLRIRERYRLADRNHFTYTMDQSKDAGRSWDPVSIEMTMTRVE